MQSFDDGKQIQQLSNAVGGTGTTTPTISTLDNEKQMGKSWGEDDGVNESEEERGSSIDDEVVEGPPDGGYGWVVVCGVTVVNACTWGLNSAYGIYLAYYLSHDLHPHATRYHYAFIGGLSVACSMILGPLVAFLFRIGWSTRQIMLLGILLQVASLIGASFLTHSLVGLFFTQGVLFGIALGLLFTSSIGTISQWFDKKRSVANGITAGGSGIGGVAFSLGLSKAIDVVGLEWSFRITALIVAVVNIIATILIKDRNKTIKPTQNSFDVGLFKRYRGFKYVLAWGFFSLLGYVVILFSLADYGLTVAGLSTQQASVMAAMLSLGMAFGRPCVGWYSDTHGRINVSWLMTVISAITVFALWMPGFKGGFALCIIFALVNGAVCGTFWTTISPVTAEIVGLKELPSALSVVWLSTVIPTTFAEAVALALRREGPGIKGVDGYLYPQIFSGVMYLVAACMLWLARKSLVDRLIEEEKKNGVEAEKGDGFMARWKRGGRWWRWVKV
ncbi:major facilitator superfamily domain-containing protein [Peziza echinospora]|nr:major facilitator superfamily domain-containing protein [Peziza echinospora]